MSQELSGDELLKAKWEKAETADEALKLLVESWEFIGQDPYYRDLNSGLEEMAERVYAKRMTLETANEIMTAVCVIPFAEMGIEQDIAAAIEKLEEITLQDILDARKRIEEDNTERREAAKDGESISISAVPDDRLIAAVYAFLNYSDTNRDPYKMESGDNIILSADMGDHYRFLAMGRRPVQQEESEECELMAGRGVELPADSH